MVQVPPDTTTSAETPTHDSQPYSSTRSATQPTAATREHSRPKLQKCLPPLSPITYYRRNMARTLPIGGAVVISCFLIAAIVTLLNSVDRSISTHYGLLRHFSVLTSQLEREVAPDVVQRVKRDPNLSHTIVVTPSGNNIRTVFGQLPVPLYGVDASEMKMAIADSGNHLVEGRLPRPNTPEIVMTRLWANNFGKKCGEWIHAKKEMLSPPPIPELGTASGFTFRLQDRGGAGHDALVAARNQLLGLAGQSKVLTGVRSDLGAVVYTLTGR